MPSVRFRIPRSAFRILPFIAAACTPATTRPPFRPFPEALRAVINAPPARVTEAARDWLAAEGIGVRLASPRDAWLETVELPGNATVRLWADPDVPGRARVAIEPVYRPVADPSRARRDLERAAPETSDAARLAQQLLAALVERFGETKY